MAGAEVNLDDDERKRRKKAVQFAVANTRLAGGVVVPETLALMQQWAAGELTDAELIDAGQRLFCVRDDEN